MGREQYSENKQDWGPGWWDVCASLGRCNQYAGGVCIVAVHCNVAVNGRWGLQVEVRGPGGKPLGVGCYGPSGGANAARTMAGAMWAALNMAENKLLPGDADESADRGPGRPGRSE